MLESASVCNIRLWYLRAPACLYHVSKSYRPPFIVMPYMCVITVSIQKFQNFSLNCSDIYNTTCSSKIASIFDIRNTWRCIREPDTLLMVLEDASVCNIRLW